VEPPNLEERITDVLQRCAGCEVTRDDCIKALEVTFFNCERAAFFVRSGEIPESSSDAFLRLRGEELDQKALEGRDIERLFDQTHVDIPLLVQYYDACDRNYEKTLRCIRGE
jgi:hypothetical protein